MLIGILFVVAAIAVAVCIPLLTRWTQEHAVGRRRTGDSGQDQERPPKKKKKRTLKGMWGVKDVRDGIIMLTRKRYRLVLRINAVNYHLLSEGEQHAVESALMSMSIAMAFPVQFLVTTEMADAKNCIADIHNRIPGMNEHMKQYAIDLAGYLDTITRDRSIYVRRSYAVICYDSNESFKKVKGELTRRAGVVMNGLSQAQVAVEPLGTEGIVDLLHREFNRGSTIKPSELVAAGGMELYKTGREGVGVA